MIAKCTHAFFKTQVYTDVKVLVLYLGRKLDDSLSESLHETEACLVTFSRDSKSKIPSSSKLWAILDFPFIKSSKIRLVIASSEIELLWELMWKSGGYFTAIGERLDVEPSLVLAVSKMNKCMPRWVVISGLDYWISYSMLYWDLFSENSCFFFFNQNINCFLFSENKLNAL